MDIDTGHVHFPANSHSAGVRFEQRWVLHFTLAGAASFDHPQGTLVTKTAEIVLVRPDVRIRWHVEGPFWKPIWFIFVPPVGFFPWMHLPEERSGLLRYRIRDPVTVRQMENDLIRAHNYAIGRHPGRELLTLNGIESALMLCHFDQAQSESQMDPRVTAALHFLGERLNRPTSVAEVATACGTSRSRLLALFRNQVGMPLMTWFEQERMRRARLLLATKFLSMRQVAAEVGYSDAKYFSKRFRHWKNKEWSSENADCHVIHKRSMQNDTGRSA